MKKVFKFVKGKKDERKEGSGEGITPSQSGNLISPTRAPEDEALIRLDNFGYVVDFSGKGKTLTKLHKAAWQGNLEKLKAALKKVEVDAVDRHNRTALHFAVAQGHPNIVWFLLGNNAKTSTADNEGHTPLLKAIECGHKDCMNLLLDRGADVNVANYSGNTGLHVALDRASLDTTSILLKMGADTEVSNNAGDYPLHIATRLENKDLIDLLLNAGASVDVPDRENRTPLMLAAKTGNDLLVRTFVERGAQLTVVDSNGWTAQDYAMLGGHENVAASLKASKKLAEKAEESEKGESWGDSQQEVGDKEPMKLKHSFEKFSDETEKDKNEDLFESPNAEPIPPYCQAPRSWEMIQAGMIDKNKDIEPKRRSITTLGTLHSRKESFTEFSASCPHTLSLNRRKGGKESNAFAKQRLSFNEEKSLRYWTNEEKKIRKHSEKIELENVLTLSEPLRKQQSNSDWDSTEISKDAPSSDSETLGRVEALQGVEEVWVSHICTDSEGKKNSWDSERSFEKVGSFPPPPSALELGADLAKSIKYMKGISMDRPPRSAADQKLWKNCRERRSLDFLDERDFVNKSVSAQCQRPTDRFSDVNRRINEQLECYDQALRELAESSKTVFSQNYHSLPSMKTESGAECRRSNSQKSSPNPPDEGPHSLPFFTQVENNEKPDAEPPVGKTEIRKTKRHMLLAMREVKHAVHVAKTFKTSMDDQIISHLARQEDEFDLEASPKGSSRSSGGNSPLGENPFFGIGRQETVLERNESGRKSSSSGTEEESTLWLQDDSRKKGLQGPDSDDDVPEIAADERLKLKRTPSFSPLGVIQREMEEESRRNKVYFGNIDELGRTLTGEGRTPSSRGELICGKNEEQHEDVFREQSPDISLSSGPIEPLGAEKDSGSEPESSHNDVSPTRNYTIRGHHEWLKCHLKTATSEKNKLEELTAQLTEKAERLQYELADAKEAAKSRDEVIHLLQGQLTRMEAAYTKSLEESVQSRLQLTAHEQEILHLKELCFRYEEEKEAAATCSGSDLVQVTLQELKQKIKILEEEKEKMKEEIMFLEEEKLLLEKRVKQEKNEESQMIDECQRWKERCRKLEEMAKAHESTEEDQERLNRFMQQNFQLEKKFFKLSEENVELKSRIRQLGAELKSERKKTKETDSVFELKKKNQEMEIKLRKLEKEMEENLVKKLKEKEQEAESLLKQFSRERDALVAAYEKKLSEGKNLFESDENERGSQRLRQVVENLQDEVVRLRANGTVKDVHVTFRKELERLKNEWNLITESQKDPQHLNALAMENLYREINDLRGKLGKEEGFADVKSEILKLKTQVDSLRMLLDGGRWPAGNQKRLEGKRRPVDKEDELAWSNLYGMKSTRRRRDGRSTSVTETLMKNRAVERSLDDDVNKMKKRKESEEKLEFLELKKEIMSLQSKMLDEKNLRHALENQMIKLNVDLSEKDNLEKEVNSLKRKIDRDCLTRSEIELLGFQKDLEVKREKYLLGEDGFGTGEEFKAKCEILAQERERSKQMRNSFGRRARSFDCPPLETSPQPKFHSCPRPLPELFFQPHYVALDPDIKHNLERKLDKSIKKYFQGTSISPVSTAKLELVKKHF